jgi:hypothetical protein
MILAPFVPTMNGARAANLTGRKTHVSHGFMRRAAIAEGAKSQLGQKFQATYSPPINSLMQKGNRSVFSSPFRLAGDKNHVNPVGFRRWGPCSVAGIFLGAGSVDRARSAITLLGRS